MRTRQILIDDFDEEPSILFALMPLVLTDNLASEGVLFKGVYGRPKEMV